MNVQDFMKENEYEIRKLLRELPMKFDSHDFMKKFAQKYESEYVDMLNVYKETHPFQNVHTQVAKQLSLNKDYFHLEKVGKVTTPNCFGEDTEVQLWMKI